MLENGGAPHDVGQGLRHKVPRAPRHHLIAHLVQQRRVLVPYGTDRVGLSAEPKIVRCHCHAHEETLLFWVTWRISCTLASPSRS